MEIEKMAEFLEEFEEYLITYYEIWIMEKTPVKIDRNAVGEFILFALDKAKADREVPRGPTAKSYNDWRRDAQKNDVEDIAGESCFSI